MDWTVANLLSRLEREVRKANRDMSNLLSNIEAPMSRLDTLQKKYSELLQDMKRTEREHIKTKKRADQLQKEKDAGRTELNRVTAMKDKLDKLARDVTKENKKLKVRLSVSIGECRAHEMQGRGDNATFDRVKASGRAPRLA